jgi:hypothetical protein
MSQFESVTLLCRRCEHATNYHYEDDLLCTFCDRIVHGMTTVQHNLKGFCGNDNLRYLEYKVKERV